MFNKDYYPTPPNLIEKLTNDVNWYEINAILEPSAGSGNICEYLNNKLSNLRHNRNKDYKSLIDCIEIETDLQAILKSKGYRLVGDDFLTYNTYKNYTYMIANVPFSQGDKHLLHMTELAERNNGSKIRCIINAETIKNPYSNYRKLLLQKLEKYNANIEYIQDAFVDAERKTNVEIAIVRIDIPTQNTSSVILDNLKQEEINITEEDNTNKVGSQLDYFKAIVLQYNNEVKLSVNIIKEFFAVKKYCLKDFNNDDNSIMSLCISGKNYSDIQTAVNECISEIRYKYWKTLLQSDKISNLMTDNIRKDWFAKLNELRQYDFSEFNINQIQFDIKTSLSKGIEDTILNLFDRFTRYAMQDGSNNIHMFTGWKTNNAYKLDKKVILPYVQAYDSWSGKLSYNYTLRNDLHDIEKVFSYIDNGTLQMGHVDLDEEIKRNFDINNNKNIQCKYFKLQFYKKGTCHIIFDDKYKDVLDRFNYVACYLRGELPNSYGKKDYKDMSQEEKKVVDSYCGKNEYVKTVEPNKEKYNFSINNLLLEG